MPAAPETAQRTHSCSPPCVQSIFAWEPFPTQQPHHKAAGQVLTETHFCFGGWGKELAGAQSAARCAERAAGTSDRIAATRFMLVNGERWCRCSR